MLLFFNCFAQNETPLNFYYIKDSLDNHYLELIEQYGDSILQEEGSGYVEFKRWSNYWDRELTPHGDFLIFDAIKKNAMASYCNYTPQHPSANWNEIGPVDQPLEFSGSHQNGIGRLNWISFDPNNSNNVFVGSPWGGLFRSTDAGLSWTNAGTDLLCQPAVASCIVSYQNSNTWFMATGDGDGYLSPGYNKSDGIWRTFNEGLTWENIGDEIDLDGIYWDWQIKKLLVDPIDANILYAATSQGVFKSTNALNPNATQVTWTNLTISNFQFGIYDIEFKPGTNNILFASGTKTIYSTNSGMTWNYIPNSQSITTNTKRICIEVTPNNPNIFYAVFIYYYSLTSATSHLWRYDYSTQIWTDKGEISNTGSYSAEYGVHWSRAQSIGVSPNDADLVFIGDVNPVCKCTTATNNNNCLWSMLLSDPTHDDIHSIKWAPNGVDIWAVTDGGAFKSTDNGITWGAFNNGLSVSTPTSVSVSETDPNYIVAGMFDNGTNVYNNYIIGNKWSHLISGDGTGTAIDYSNPQYQFGSSAAHSLFRSNDFGSSFPTQLSAFTANWNISIVQNSVAPNVFYQATNEVYKNINKGVGPWVPISNFSSLIPKENVINVWTTPGSGNYLFASMYYPSNPNGSYHNLYLTKQANATNPQWLLLSQPITQNHWINGIAGDYDDPEIFYITYEGGIPNEKVFKYDGHLNQWTNMSFNLSNLSMRNIVVEKGSDGGLYIGTDFGIYYTNNKRIQQYPNSQWIRYSTNLPRIDATVSAINYIDNNIYAATSGRGIWRSGLACPSDFDLTLSGISPTYFYEAQNKIYSTASISNTVNAKYRGGYSIEMNPGFIADYGSVFLAYLHPCDHAGNSFKLLEPGFSEMNNEVLAENSEENILIFPNPTSGDFILSRSSSLENENSNLNFENIPVSVWDAFGRNILNKNFVDETLSIDLSNYSKGIYLLIFKDGNGIQTIKKIVLK